MEFQGKWAHFYKKCLSLIESRPGFNDSYLPLLERYVFVTQKMADVSDKMATEDATVERTNNDGHTNKESNPLMRVFVILNKESLALAKELELTPAASKKVKGDLDKKKKGGFDTETPMKKLA